MAGWHDDGARGLVVFVRGLPQGERGNRRGGGSQSFAQLISRLKGDLGDSWRVEVYDHGQKATSRADLDGIVRDLAAHIRGWAGEISEGVEPPARIILIGHSFGGVLARAAFVLDANDPRSLNGRRWTRMVDRIVLLGSPNAGFRLDTRYTPLAWKIAWYLTTPFVDFTIEKVVVGGYWITNLRLRWLETFRRLARDAEAGDASRPPTVVQVLGTRDDLVEREDILDTRYMGDTIVVEIPGATHLGLIDLSIAADPDLRWEQLRGAILGRADEVASPPTPLSSAPTYFVLHGIRASAYEDWGRDLEAAIRRAEGDQNEVQVVRPDTGYFSAIEFALPFTRRRKIHEFLKLYGDAYASTEPDRFRFAGHSNGTYMMAHALDRIPAMHFERIYLAGTVLPRNYAWGDVVDRGQLAGRDTSSVRVRTDRATADVPVGILCSWLRGLGSRDIGTAGVDGFEFAPDLVRDGGLIRGGHGAAFIPPPAPKEATKTLGATATGVDPPDNPNIESIAGFLVRGDAGTPGNAAEHPLFRFLSRFVGNPVVAWTVAGGLAVGACVGFVALMGLIGRTRATMLAGGALSAIWAVLRTI
ncbi:alpha/beta fold hydrolase [Agromyces humatus]|uniref:AB hydrolase-1 domain-containing protein n=1 Tax=Agromyces humatus TaxID=279573 RepID=A0ABP4X0R3_9MICO|nr:alpha/beta fold hydrolase [Agromyces humatus]